MVVNFDPYLVVVMVVIDVNKSGIDIQSSRLLKGAVNM